ncbi:MAG: UDP-glucose/GDP-mannose dehydrogenase family protein [Candidatus Cloacimonetes bacterium]|nr:UDP-glucose/GDP-mannose dehydrogenase family protein [Candidatus Cloacimonadota bacterium]
MGLVTSVGLAELGNTVTVIDLNESKVAMINSAQAPFFEPGLHELLQKHVGSSLFASTTFEDVADSEISFICVDTPADETGHVNLTKVKSSACSIGLALQGLETFHTVVIKSTVPPGTTESVIIPLILGKSKRNFSTLGFSANPEFLREGQAVADFMHPDRIVIGVSDGRAEEILTRMYCKIDAPILTTSIKSAEMAKHVSNAFLATKISFANEVGNICKNLEIDVYDVMRCVGSDHRISPNFLSAGVGFGGSCLPKDLKALIHLAEALGEEPFLLHAVKKVNEKQPERIYRLLERKLGKLKNKRIAVLGLAFKPNTDDIRGSPAIPVIQSLDAKGATVIAYDPLAVENMRGVFPRIKYAKHPLEALTGADACVLLTEWPEFECLDSEFDAMQTRIVIEGRKILLCKNKEGVCW